MSDGQKFDSASVSNGARERIQKKKGLGAREAPRPDFRAQGEERGGVTSGGNKRDTWKMGSPEIGFKKGLSEHAALLKNIVPFSPSNAGFRNSGIPRAAASAYRKKRALETCSKAQEIRAQGEKERGVPRSGGNKRDNQEMGIFIFSFKGRQTVPPEAPKSKQATVTPRVIGHGGLLLRQLHPTKLQR